MSLNDKYMDSIKYYKSIFIIANKVFKNTCINIQNQRRNANLLNETLIELLQRYAGLDIRSNDLKDVNLHKDTIVKNVCDAHFINFISGDVNQLSTKYPNSQYTVYKCSKIGSFHIPEHQTQWIAAMDSIGCLCLRTKQDNNKFHLQYFNRTYLTQFKISKVYYYVISNDYNANPLEILEQVSAIHRCQVNTCAADTTEIPINDTIPRIVLGHGAMVSAYLTYVTYYDDWDSTREYFVVRQYNDEYDAKDDLLYERLAYYALQPTGGLKCTPLFRDNYLAFIKQAQEPKYGLYAAFSGLNTDLKQLMNPDQASPPLSEPIFFSIMNIVFYVLNLLHLAGVAHNDVKPANIFYNTPHAKAVLGDFGACGEQFINSIYAPQYARVDQIFNKGFKKSITKEKVINKLRAVIISHLKIIRPFYRDKWACILILIEYRDLLDTHLKQSDPTQIDLMPPQIIFMNNVIAYLLEICLVEDKLLPYIDVHNNVLFQPVMNDEQHADYVEKLKGLKSQKPSRIRIPYDDDQQMPRVFYGGQDITSQYKREILSSERNDLINLLDLKRVDNTYYGQTPPNLPPTSNKTQTNTIHMGDGTSVYMTDVKVSISKQELQDWDAFVETLTLQSGGSYKLSNNRNLLVSSILLCVTIFLSFH